MRDCQQIRNEYAETKAAEVQCEVERRRRRGYETRQADGVQWPHVVVFHGGPEKLRRDWLAVVHIAFAWVVSDYAVDDCAFFSIDGVSGRWPRNCRCNEEILRTFH